MSGHNKWSSIKHKKGAMDAKRGKIFTKLIKEITIAAKQAGGNADMNPRLRAAIASAKSSNMPATNIEKAIKKGTGELEGVSYEEATYEGYGQGGVAIIVETLSDNKKRTVAEVRHIFSKYGGNLAENGSVSWNFETLGLIVLQTDADEDTLMMQALDAGAIDVVNEDGLFEVYTQAKDLHSVMDELEKQNYKIKSAELTRKPKSLVKADDVAQKLLVLLDKLEDSDDVQRVYANYDISDEVLEGLEK